MQGAYNMKGLKKWELMLSFWIVLKLWVIFLELGMNGIVRDEWNVL